MPRQQILIIGGTRGTGRAAASLFRARGYAVSVMARRLPATAAERIRGVRYWAADLLDSGAVRSSIRDMVDRRGPLASVVFLQRYRGEGDTWVGEIETNLTATKAMIDILVRDFQLRNCSLVMVSSVNARLISEHMGVGYHVAKAGLNQMVRYYAVALGPRGIRVNSVSPGTFIKAEARSFYRKNKALVSAYSKIVPLGRMCSVTEVVEAVAFLCGKASSFISGQDLVVDGGLTWVYQETLAGELASARGKRKSRNRT